MGKLKQRRRGEQQGNGGSRRQGCQRLSPAAGPSTRFPTPCRVFCSVQLAQSPPCSAPLLHVTLLLTCARGSSSVGQRTSRVLSPPSKHQVLVPRAPALTRRGRSSCAAPWKRAPSYRQARATCTQGRRSVIPAAGEAGTRVHVCWCQQLSLLGWLQCRSHTGKETRQPMG